MSLRLPRAALAACAIPLLFPALAWAETGQIAGKVSASPAKYLKETVVYLEGAAKGRTPKTETMDQRHMTFIPHLLDITEGDTVKFTNHDSVNHNVFSPDVDAYNLGNFPPGQSRSHTFTKPGGYSQLCSLHPEMLAYVFVSPTPYHAKVKADGAYEIKGVPPGSYQLAVWNSHLKAAAQPVTVAAGQTARVDVSLQH